MTLAPQVLLADPDQLLSRTLMRVLVVLGSRVLAEHHATASAEPNWLIVISIPSMSASCRKSMFASRPKP